MPHSDPPPAHDSETARLRDRVTQLEAALDARQFVHLPIEVDQASFHAVYEHAIVGFYRTTPDGRILFVNPALVRMLGYDSAEELQRRNLEKQGFEPDYSRAAFKAELERDGQVIGLEGVWHRKDGVPIYIRENCRAIRDATGRTLFYDGSVEDLTEQRRAEAARRESEVVLRSLVEQAGDGFMVVDRTGRIQDVNTASCSLLGYTRGELLSLSLRDIDPDLRPDRYLAQFDAMEPGRPMTLETVLRRRDGSSVPVEVSASRVLINEAPALLTLIRDITIRRQREHERASLQEQLVQAQKMESVARLAGGIAHDFNNMLSVILGNTEMLLGHLGPDDPRRQDLQNIHQAAQRSSRLTQQLLGYARRQPINPKVIDPNASIAEMLTMLRRLMGEHIELTFSPGSQVPLVRIDPGQFDQVLANLLVNARDAISRTGSVRIATAARGVEPDTRPASAADCPPGEYATITVTDSGHGMDAETLAKVFEPFFTTKPVGQGTGLGLATVYGIVRQNGGFVTVDSAPGAGATFTICLPRHDETRHERVQVQHAPQQAPSGTETILVVEDEPALLALAARVLRQDGYTVITAATPEEAVRLAATHDTIDLLLTDVVMPTMNGRELATQLQRTSARLQCLFMSGYEADLLTAHGVIADGLNFLPKPWTRQALVTKVRALLDRASPR